MNPSFLLARPRHYVALAFMAAGIMLWEVLLTRIYSVLLYYHFAFMAVSVAMFGLALGAVCVMLRDVKGAVRLPPTDYDIGTLAFMTGVSMVIAITAQLCIAPTTLHGSAHFLPFLVRTYILSALPFIPAGAFTCILLTRSTDVQRLYACDLLGAGLGCMALPYLLVIFGGPGAVLVAAAIPCASAWVLLRESKPRRLIALLCLIGLVAFACMNRGTPLLRVRWRHGVPVAAPLFERWNAFSRIIVHPGENENEGWGIEKFWRGRFPRVPELELEIDSGAGTPITHFDGNLEPLQFLRYDITSFVHYLRPDSNVLIIGPGGGRDILSALNFHQRSICAVEVNPAIVQAVNGVYGDFTGHLDRRADVRFVVDEGRSFIQKTSTRFDIIQASLVDTVAATAAGAYSFVENGLYTVEAWRLFLQHLTPRGMISFSRWYYGSTTWPVEVSRMVALAAEALRQEGLRPADHLLVIRNSMLHSHAEGLATILVSSAALTAADLRVAQKTCRELKCEVALAAGQGDALLSAIINSADRPGLYSALPLDISPPTDDKPYFFFHARLKDVLQRRDGRQFGNSAFNLPAVRMLWELTLMTLIFSILLIVWPYTVLSRQPRWRVQPWTISMGLPLYFGLIGAAFMFLEIAWMQRFSLFLGHPTYGFTVILFGLLVATGAGSWMVPFFKNAALPFLLIPCLLLTDLVGLPIMIDAAGKALLVRILLTFGFVGIPAVLMGFYFPLGMALAQRFAEERVEWFWTINGALSVLGSVLAMATTLAAGIRFTLWLGAALYFMAACLLLIIQRTLPEK